MAWHSNQQTGRDHQEAMYSKVGQIQKCVNTLFLALKLGMLSADFLEEAD